MMRKLNHPNVVKVLDYVVVEPNAYMFLEFCGGGELFERVISAGKMAETEARGYIQQIVQGIAHCHARGVVHRDLKLENIMLSTEGVVKIIDFGLAAEFEQNRDGTFKFAMLTETCGSKSYAAPGACLAAPGLGGSGHWGEGRGGQLGRGTGEDDTHLS